MAGHRGECGGDFLQAGFDVGGGWAGVSVSGVGAGYAVAEVALTQVRVVWRSQWLEMLCEAAPPLAP